MPMRTLVAILLATAFTFLSVASAQDEADPYERFRSDSDRADLPFNDSHIKRFEDGAVAVPPLPTDEELVEVPLDTLPAGMRAYLHLPSVTVEQLVTRYWLVVKGDGGGYNATYEGTRCNTHEYRVYAYGFPNRNDPVKLAPDTSWLSAARPEYRDEFASDILCAGITPKTLAQIRASIRGTFSYQNPYSEYIDL